MKKILLVPVGGLANRIHAVSSMASFCRDNNIQLQIIWFKNKGMGCNFHDILTFIDGEVKFITPKRWHYLLYYPPRKRNLWISYLFQKMIFDCRYYNYKGNNPFIEWFNNHRHKRSFYVIHCWHFYIVEKISSQIKPNQRVQAIIDEQLKNLSHHTVGIHIRRTDHIKSIKESPLTLFIDKMKEEITNDSETCFYVASDSPEVKKELECIFGNRIIMQDKPVRRDTKEGIIDALVELYTLAATQKIYGSSGSSFSLLASELYGISFKVLKNNQS